MAKGRDRNVTEIQLCTWYEKNKILKNRYVLTILDIAKTRILIYYKKKCAMLR